jgi:hypothetical protein
MSSSFLRLLARLPGILAGNVARPAPAGARAVSGIRTSHRTLVQSRRDARLSEGVTPVSEAEKALLINIGIAIAIPVLIPLAFLIWLFLPRGQRSPGYRRALGLELLHWSRPQEMALLRRTS